jgi:hypothetical protein
MTFGKCVWDGCTRHAVKQATRACEAHHQIMRDSPCTQCRGQLRSTRELQVGRCRRCAAGQAA